jgi:glycosyltransferase involved in cell wall biosynthesis
VDLIFDQAPASLRSWIEKVQKSIVAVFSEISQIDEPVFEALSRDNANARVDLFYWNDHGLRRAALDPELGQVPVFPDLAELPSHMRRHWIDSRRHGVDTLINAILEKSPEFVILNDLSTRVKFTISRRLRRKGVPVGFRSDKNYLSARAHTGLKLALERAAYRFGFDIFFNVADLSSRYYAWPAGKSQTLFPYPTDILKFSPHEHIGMRQAMRQKLNIPQDAIVLLCVAKFVDRENPMDVIRTYVEAYRRIGNIYLIAVGSGELMPSMEALAAEQSAGENIRFVGYVPFAELQDYFFASDIYLHLAKREPWGVSVSDALCAGLGVVTTDHVGAGVELLRDELQKYVVPIGRPDLVATLVCDLVKQNAIGETFAAARKRVCDTYSSIATARRLASTGA